MATILVEHVRREAEMAYTYLLEGLEGVTQEQAWAAASLGGSDYIHTSGSILSIVQHVAPCKFMYGSAAFRDTEIRWRDCAARLDAIGSDWQASLDYLAEAQAYWMASWQNLTDEELEKPRKTNWGQEWTTSKIIFVMSHHDSYHAGQVSFLRALLKPTSEPPATFEADDIRKYCQDSPSW